MKYNLMQIFNKRVLPGVVAVLALASGNTFASYSHNDHSESDTSSGNYGIKVYGERFAGLPTLVAPSLPAFGTKVNINFSKSASAGTLTVTDHGSKSSFIAPDKKYGIKSTDYLLSATFDNTGSFVSGTVSISGRFDHARTSELLMTADLISFAKSANGSMWGFNTNNIWCNAAINAAIGGCTTSEVVYLSLDNSQKSLRKSWKTTGVALTSVPVPAAAWLFGSGLLGLAGLVRRNDA